MLAACSHWMSHAFLVVSHMPMLWQRPTHILLARSAHTISIRPCHHCAACANTSPLTSWHAAHESTRRVLVEHAAAFARCCTAKPGLCEELVPNVITLLHDPSWRVRYCAASHVHELAEAFGQEVTRCAVCHFGCRGARLWRLSGIISVHPAMLVFVSTAH